MSNSKDNQGTGGSATKGNSESTDTSTARDREMGREAKPKGDLGEDGKTWTPPAGKQGMSNRPDDE